MQHHLAELSLLLRVLLARLSVIDVTGWILIDSYITIFDSIYRIEAKINPAIHKSFIVILTGGWNITLIFGLGCVIRGIGGVILGVFYLSVFF